jgi:cytosine/adenosine deaminase-related metal-dependent hydrolase
VFDGEYSDIMPEAAQITPGLSAAIRDYNPLVPHSLAHSMALLEECISAFDHRSGRIRVFPAPSNPVRCSNAFLVACQHIAERYDTGIHCHLLETQRQATLAQAQYGRTMVSQLFSLGALDSRWSCAHCNWLTDEDISLMAKCGAVAVLNPESNLKIGSGVPRIPAFLKEGLNCAIGTDGASTNDNLVLQEALQLTALLHRTSESDLSQWVSAAQVLRMGTIGGAAAMQEPHLGRIAVGQKADLVLYDLHSSVWTPCNDPLQQFVFGERGANVRSVIIDGNLVMDEGRILSFDENAVLRNARTLLQDTRKRNGGIRMIAEAFGPNH